MIRLLLFLAVLIPVPVISQDYINKNRNQVKKELKNIKPPGKDASVHLSETDSSLVLTIKGPGNSAADFIYEFGKSDTCRLEKVVAGCKACFTRYLEEALSKPVYNWKKLNENQYISGFDSRRMLELPVDGQSYTFRIFRLDWTREMYDLLSGQ